MKNLRRSHRNIITDIFQPASSRASPHRMEFEDLKSINPANFSLPEKEVVCTRRVLTLDGSRTSCECRSTMVRQQQQHQGQNDLAVLNWKINNELLLEVGKNNKWPAHGQWPYSEQGVGLPLWLDGRVRGKGSVFYITKLLFCNKILFIKTNNKMVRIKKFQMHIHLKSN